MEQHIIERTNLAFKEIEDLMVDGSLQKYGLLGKLFKPPIRGIRFLLLGFKELFREATVMGFLFFFLMAAAIKIVPLEYFYAAHYGILIFSILLAFFHRHQRLQRDESPLKS